MKPRLQIKKYSNRRLYDVSQKRYVTLDELAGLIRNGHKIEVLDSKTGEDITQDVLIQIILESRKDDGKTIFTNEFLHMMIQSREMARSESEEFFHKYLPNIFSAYMQWQSEAQNQFLQWTRLGWGAMMPGFPDWGMPRPPAGQSCMNWDPPSDGGHTPQPPGKTSVHQGVNQDSQRPASDNPQAAEEIGRLKRKVAQMEAEMEAQIKPQN